MLLGLVEFLRLEPPVRQLTSGASALRDATRALGPAPGDWTDARIQSAQALQGEAAGLLASGRDSITQDPLLRFLHGLPLLGDQVDAAFDLSSSSAAAAVAFNEVLTVAREYDRARSDPAPPGPKLLSLISSSAGPLGHADDQLRPQLQALHADLSHPLLPPLRSRVRDAITALTPAEAQAAAGATAGKYLPAALGERTPKTYLLLFDNPAELRPAGGLAGVVGTVTLDRGTPSTIEVRDVSLINSLAKEIFPPPYPIARYLVMYNHSLEISDAGWDPNFPATARISEQIFRSATGEDVDGTIAIDPYAIGAMLAVTGPVDVPGIGKFTSANFFERINFIINVPGPSHVGKEALGQIAKVIIARVLSQPLNRFADILTVFQQQAGARHIQVAMHDARLIDAAARVNYDGHIVAGVEDYILVTDGNVGATKGDYYMHKKMGVRVELPQGGVSRHEITLDYELPPPVDDTDRALNQGVGEYRNYLRIFIPQEATVTSFRFTEDGKPSSDGGLDRDDIQDERRSVGIFFRLPRGHRVQVRLAYQMPLPPEPNYELYIQKQAGIPERPTTIEASYPGGVVKRQERQDHDIDFRVSW